MKISSRSFRRIASSFLVLTTVMAALGVTAGTVSAAKPRPTPVPVPTSPPAPTPQPNAAPSAPMIRVGAVTATYVDIVWDTPADDNTRPDQFQYTYTLIGDPRFQFQTEVPTCSSYCFGTTVLRLSRSEAGKQVAVRAYDSGYLASALSNVLIVP